MVSPLALISSAISPPRVGCAKTRTIGFGNGAQPTSAPVPSGTIVNHNIQPYLTFTNTSSIQSPLTQGMYFRGSIVGSRLNLLG
jgi:hypothetical protein